jgi:hypothetical protein
MHARSYQRIRVNVDHIFVLPVQVERAIRAEAVKAVLFALFVPGSVPKITAWTSFE